jgi:uncharacterized protein
MKFIGRKEELETLNRLHKKSSASLIVIRGRRRIGKSRLIEEFTNEKNAWVFSGLPPTNKTTKQSQLNIFCNQMEKIFKLPKLRMNNWHEALSLLGTFAKKQKLIIVFDEISWMGSKDSDFLGYLKTAWDQYFSLNPNLIFILCGSVSSWIEENILTSTGFVGRVSIDMNLKELSLKESNEFFKDHKFKISAFEKLKMLSITGGVPKYLEEIVPKDSAETNLQKMCFKENGILFREFEQIFSDIFSKKYNTYSNIVQILEKNCYNLNEICKKLNINKGGVISKYLHNLKISGFISEDPSWNLKSKKISKNKKFRLKDNYLRFYLKYIKPNKEKIEQNSFQLPSLINFPGWKSIMGLQFENLVLNNRFELLRILKIDPTELIMMGPFFQKPTLRQKGCQIDLLIQTKYSLYVCEIKFHFSEISKKVTDDVEQKIKRLSCPRGYSIRPVLIHVNGISPQVQHSGFFNKIIDFSEFFAPVI